MRKKKTARSRRRKRAAPRAAPRRIFLVSGVDLGDGVRVKAWLIVSKAGVEVRQYRHRKAWKLELPDAAALFARRAQLVEASVVLASPLPAEEVQQVLFGGEA